MGSPDRGRGWKWRGVGGLWTDPGSRINWTRWTVGEPANIRESRIAPGDSD